VQGLSLANEKFGNFVLRLRDTAMVSVHREHAVLRMVMGHIFGVPDFEINWVGGK
jgi:hypothetical protein